MRNRLVITVLEEQGHAELRVGIRIVRDELDDLSIGFDGAFQISRDFQRASKVPVGLDELGVGVDGGSIRFYSLVDFPLVLKAHPQIVQNHGIIRLQVKRNTELRDCSFQVPLVPERNTQIVIGIDIVRLKPNRRA